MTECIGDFNSFMEFYRRRARALAMVTEDCTLATLAPAWVVDEQSLRRPDGGFFLVRGRRVTRAAGREVPNWAQPLIFNDGGGTVALIKDNSTGYVLVRVKGEPGAVGLELDDCTLQTRVLVSAPLQFSRANLERHSRAAAGDSTVKPVPLVHLQDGRFATLWENVCEDPGRNADKVNRNGLIAVQSVGAIEADIAACAEHDDFCWVPIEVLREIRRAGYANSHLRSVMAMFV